MENNDLPEFIDLDSILAVYEEKVRTGELDSVELGYMLKLFNIAQ